VSNKESSLVRELESVKAKIVQAQANLKSFQKLCETKEKIRHLDLEGALNEVISYVEVSLRQIVS